MEMISIHVSCTAAVMLYFQPLHQTDFLESISQSPLTFLNSLSTGNSKTENKQAIYNRQDIHD